MYSVFLVEDEVVVREGIRNSIPWETTRYSLAGEAPDGEMALSILKDVKPDILVTDIRMPFMDGLSLARIVKQTQPWIKIIILSGHDEFHYARDAISIGVEEYLLKPVSAADMLNALDKVAARIENEKRNLDNIENLKRQVLSTGDMLKDQWLANLVTGIVDTGDAIAQARDHGIDLIAHSYAVIIAEVSVADENFRELAKAKGTILSQLASRADILCFSPGLDRVVLIIKSADKESLEELAYTIAQGIKFETERNTACFLSVGIGSSVERIGGIPHSYADALRALKYLTATGRHAIVGINDIQTIDESDIAKIGSDPVVNKLRYVSRSDIDCFVDEYAALQGESPSKTSFVGYYLLYDLVVAATALIGELRGDVSSVFPARLQQEELIAIASQKDSFVGEIRRIVSAVIACREAAGESRYGGMIQKAKRYIDEHFSDPDISLHTVASVVNLSPNHFSTIFSQESGESFIDYLTCVRIERAKSLLLTSQMKSVDISYDVGFNDPHYFSFIFKKRTGLSPREFRSEKNETSE